MDLPLEEGEYVLWITKNEIWRILSVDGLPSHPTLYYAERVHPSTESVSVRKVISDARVNIPGEFKRLTELEVIAWAAK